MASLSLLLSLSFFALFSPSLSDNKVSLELYYETLCPYCSKFIVNRLSKIFKNELSTIVDLKLVPWGNAILGSNATFVCQHGPDECFLNTVEACAINTWPQTDKHFPFIYCVEDLVKQGKHEEWKSCFEKLQLDSKPITQCYKSEDGKKLELKYAAETNALKPPHTFVPWVVVDGKPLYEDFSNFISYVWKAYKGSDPPRSCTKAADLREVNAKPKDSFRYMERGVSTREQVI